MIAVGNRLKVLSLCTRNSSDPLFEKAMAVGSGVVSTFNRKVRMGLKIVISTSRYNTEKKNVIEELERLKASRQVAIDSIYDCEQHCTVIGRVAKQEGINKTVIPQCDWFLLLAPLNHVGRQTALEFLAACYACRDNGSPVINLFRCKNPIAAAVGQHPFSRAKKDVEVERLLAVAKRILHTGPHYEVDYNYSDDDSSLKYKIGDEYDKICREKLFHTQQFSALACKGDEITARELYYDKNRAEERFGFCREMYLFRNSVDGRLTEAVESKTKIVVVTGAPGSGKTRAIYECVRRVLADENVVLLHPKNVGDVMERIAFLEEKSDGDENYYIVCDQIKDVFSSMEEKAVRQFFRTLVRTPRLFLLASSVRHSYNVFLENFSVLKEWFGDRFLTQLIDIPAISKDEDKNNIQAWLSHNFPAEKGETIGDYIPGLNDYVDRIVGDLYEKTVDSPFGPYLAAFFRAVQITSMFRRTTPLFIPVMILRKEYEEDSERLFVRQCMQILNYLIDKNCIEVWKETDGEGRKKDICVRLSERMFDFDEIEEYDGEEMESILPVDYVYSVNELVWQAMQEKEDERRAREEETPFSYDMNRDAEIKQCMKLFYKTFPTPKSLERILPRVPRTVGEGSNLSAIRKFVRNKVGVFAKTSPGNDSVKLTYNMLIGRADDWDEVEALLREMETAGMEPDENTLGELYRYAAIHCSVDDAVSGFLRSFQEKQGIADGLYLLYRKLLFQTNTFQEGVEFLREHAFVSKARLYAGDTQSLSHWNGQRIFRLLSRRAESYDDWKRLLQLYDDVSFEIDNVVLFSWVRSARHHVGRLKEICQMLLIDEPTWQVGIREQRYELLIAYLIMNAPDFDTSVYFYDQNYDRTGNDNYRLLALCFKNCNNWDYQRAVRYLDRVERRTAEKRQTVPAIIYNQLVGIAPTHDDACYFMDRIKRIDSFTLSNLLQDILRTSGKDEKRFIYAYDLIERPQFRPLRSDIHVVAVLFALATHIGHEEYILSMAGRESGNEYEAQKTIRMIEASDEIASIRMRKPYRGLEEAYQLFLDARKRRLSDAHKVKSDIYSTIANRIHSEKEELETKEKYRREWIEIVRKDDDRIVKDEHFYSAVYRFYRLDAVVCDGRVGEDFQQSIETVGAVHNKTFNNLLLALKSAYGFDEMKIFYAYYIRWYVRSGRPASLLPDHRTYTYLLEAARTAEEVAYVYAEYGNMGVRGSRKLSETLRDAEKRTGVRLKRAEASVGREKTEHEKENLSLVHHRLSSGTSTTEEILAYLRNYIEKYDFVTPSILNSALSGIYKERHRGKPYRYRLLMEVIGQYGLEKSFTPYTYLNLIKLSPAFDDMRMWLSRAATDECRCEVLFGGIACNFKIAQHDIAINREYFRRWEAIYRELGFEYALESCWDTAGIYLRIETEEGLVQDAENAVPIVASLIEKFYRHRRKFKADTFKHLSLNSMIDRIQARYVGERDKWEKIRNYFGGNS